MENRVFIEVEKNRVERFRLEIVGILENGVTETEITKRFAVANKALSLWLKEKLSIHQIAGSLPIEFTVNKGAILIIGQSGTGKSILLNKLRNNWLMQDYKGISIDFGGGSKKIAASLKDAVIESYSSKPNKISFNLFDIKAKEGEVFESSELNHLQIPKYRLELLSKILKLFCLNRCHKDEVVELDKAEVEKLIKQMLELTYCKLSSNTPVVKDFISKLRLMGETQRLANKVADKLELFVKETSGFCDWANSNGETAYSKNIYKVFQIRYLSNNANDLIRKAKLLYEVDNFLVSNVSSKKFVDIDEVMQLDTDPILSLLSEIIYKSDVNDSFPKTVVALVYQGCRDYLQSSFSKVIIRTRKYIFKSWENWNHRSEVLELNQSKIAESLIIDHKNFSQCLLTDNKGDGVLLSIEYNQAEDTLLC